MLVGVSGKIGSGKDLVGKIVATLVWLNSSPSSNMLYENKLEEPIEEFVKSSLMFSPKGWRGFCNVGIESGWKIKKYADKLKNIVCLLLGCSRVDLEDHNFKDRELGEDWWYFLLTKHNGVCGLSSELKDYSSHKEFEEDEMVKECLENEVNVELIKLTPRKLLQMLGTECGRQILHPNIWINSLFSDYTLIDNASWQDSAAEPTYQNWVVTDMRFENEASAIKSRGGITIRVNRPCTVCGGLGKHKMDCQPIEHESETALDTYVFDYTIDNNGTILELVEKVKIILKNERIL